MVAEDPENKEVKMEVPQKRAEDPREGDRSGNAALPVSLSLLGSSPWRLKEIMLHLTILNSLLKFCLISSNLLRKFNAGSVRD